MARGEASGERDAARAEAWTKDVDSMGRASARVAKRLYLRIVVGKRLPEPAFKLGCWF